MSKAYVSEYAGLKLVYGPGGAVAQCPEGPPIATQVVDFSGGAAATTNPFNAKTKFVRVMVDAICSRKWGSAPTATTSDERMSAEQTEYLGVPADHGVSTDSTKTAYKLGFIANS